TDLVARLMSATPGTNAMAACASVRGQVQPVFALVKARCADELARSVAEGERAMHRWLRTLEAVTVDFDDAQAFTNINEPSSNGNQETRATGVSD
ncbi:MAG: hypothetical protein ACXW14_08730, partial [Burkholderiaceae bacterium]